MLLKKGIMMNELINYDIVVIGSGPGGYISAIRASQLGFKTALVEKYNTLGGTCLNVGCIPSKAILDSSEHYFQSQKTFLNHGISFNSLTLDFQKMIFRKEKVVKKILEGLKFLLRKNKIDIYHGVGSFKEENHLMVYQPDNIVEIKFNLSSYVKEVKFKNNEVIIKGKSQGERDFEISGDYCLVAIGRKPYTEGLGLQNIGIEIDKSGYILVNKYLQTNVNNIYAIGDVIGGSMLAHKAEEEALFVIEHLSGQKPLKINYNLIPAVIYTWPE